MTMGLHYEAKPSGHQQQEGTHSLTLKLEILAAPVSLFKSPRMERQWRMDGKTEVREIHKVDAIVDVSLR
jgi:hypothetical protein